MCGIAGFIDFTQSSSTDILRRCTDILSHRGPDGSGFDFFPEENCQVGLGHRRLSIIDLSTAASQPMKYKHYSIIFNGEIYNYADIRQDLMSKGHVFHSHSDTEVVLHAWEQWGHDMLGRFIGMFACCIYDSRDKKLHCFRDRAGVKPFYYYWHNGLFLFASELKSFHQHPGFRKKINPSALSQFLQYGYILAPQCIFDQAHKLLPGHYLSFDLRMRSFSLTKYWDVYDAYNQPKLDVSEKEAVDETERLLISACQYRMVSDVPVGVFLSGGYDSTAVTALLQANQTEKLKTFTIGFHEEDHNEAPFAKEVARHLGTDHTEYYCTTKEAQEIIPTIPFFCDEPFGDSSFIPTTLVSKLARQQVTVALSADAGDEIFAGYPKYPLALDFLKKLNRIPGFVKTPAAAVLQQMPDNWLIKLSGNTAASIKKERFSDLLREKRLTSTGIMDRLMSQVYSDRQLSGLLTTEPTRPYSFFDSDEQLRQSLGSLDRMLAVDYKTYMVDDILVKVDRAGMSVSLEGREPLLDHRLVEWAARLPESCKLNNGSTKHILRQIVHRYVPREIMERPKMGFGVPVFQWLKNDLRYYCDEFMSDAAFARHGLFRPDGVEHIRQRFFAGDRNYNSLFWYLLMFQMWYKKWMD